MASYVFLAAGPAWAAQAPHLNTEIGQDYAIAPRLGVQETFTDNAFLTPTRKSADLVTRLSAGAIAVVNTGLTKANVDMAVSYDQYLNNPRLSGWSMAGNGYGSYTVIPGFLSIEGEGTVANGSISTFGTPSVDRSGTFGRVQLSTYDIGPRITTTLDDFADVNILARFAQVLYGSGDTSGLVSASSAPATIAPAAIAPGSIIPLPADASIVDILGVLDTGTRFPWYQLITTGNYERDDRGFQLYTGTESAFFRVLDDLRLIARGGYDDVTQPNVVDIHSPIARGGVEWSVNRESRVTLEAGTRYQRATWNADVYLQFSDRIYFTGRYYEVLEPAQLQIHDSFSEFVTQRAVLPTAIAPQVFAVNGNLYNQTSLTKKAQGRLVYDWEADSVSLDMTWDDREFVATGDKNRVLIGNAAYFRHIAPDLVSEIRVSYAQTFASVIYGASTYYGGELALAYDLNSGLAARAGYAFNHQMQTSPVRQALSENVVFAAIERRFNQ